MTDLTETVREFLHFSWLTGPIFEKELRVASRRWRHYWIRFAYLCLLGIILGLLWHTIVGTGDGIHAMPRMAEAGQAMTVYLVWFQFIVCQILAAVLLSTSISDEIHHRTLGVLMTTPINAFQIVTGKLFSGLLQLILLVGLSLPILAAIRFFGGVSWDFLVTGIGMTLCAMILVGSISLLVSMYCHRHAMIIVTFLIIIGIWALIPLLGLIPGIVFDLYPERPWRVFFSYCNPYFSLITATEALLSPGKAALSTPWYWQCNGLLMLIASGIVLAVATARVRTVALRQVCGQMTASKRPIENSPEHVPARSVTELPHVLWCYPILGKELRGSLLGRHPIRARARIRLFILALVVLYIGLAMGGTISEESVHIGFSMCLMGLASVFTVVIPATAITSEKESRSWPILLATSLEDRRILRAKWLGAIRRILPAWTFLFGHIGLFTLLGIIHPLALVQVLMIMTGVILLLIGSGFLFSSLCRRTTVAVILNIVFALTIWLLVPLLLVMIDVLTQRSHGVLENVLYYHPFFQIGMVMSACANGWGSIQNYHWAVFEMRGASDATVFLFISLLLHATMGRVLAQGAERLFRYRIF
jgi:ABC-type transport system involved in multi-copper enzyme maturation permease subunit